MKRLNYILILLCSFSAKAESSNNILSPNDYALKVCLDNNYEKINAYRREDLKDYSSFNIKNVDQQLLLSDFVKANTNAFYKENLPIHIESSPPPYNAIFQKCIGFYNSEKLKIFIKKNIKNS